jgi:hypothetical protein
MYIPSKCWMAFTRLHGVTPRTVIALGTAYWGQRIAEDWKRSGRGLILGTFVEGPPLWSSGQCSWLQIQRSGFDSRRYQIFWEVVDLERGPLSLVSTIEELLERKSSGTDLENQEYSRRNPSRWPRVTPLSEKLGINFANNRRSLGRYSSLSCSGYGLCMFLEVLRCEIVRRTSVGLKISGQRFEVATRHERLVFCKCWRRLVWSKRLIRKGVEICVHSFNRWTARGGGWLGNEWGKAVNAS